MTDSNSNRPPSGPISRKEQGSIRARFLFAFLFGLLGAVALGAGALYAYDLQYEGRILPGIRVGNVDLSGMSPAEAKAKLDAAYDSFDAGEVVLKSSSGTRRISYEQLGRRLDLDALVAEAVAAGRAGGGVERVLGSAQTAIRGITIEPRVVYDAAAIQTAVDEIADKMDFEPVDATVKGGKGGFTFAPGSDGRKVDRNGPLGPIAEALGRVSTGARIEVPITVSRLEPRVTTAEAEAAVNAARILGRAVTIKNGDEEWKVGAGVIRTWVRFVTTEEGTVRPVVDTTGLAKALEPVEEKVFRKPKNASYLIGKGGEIVGVSEGQTGRGLDVAATSEAISALFQVRANGKVEDIVEPVFKTVAPSLTTEEARKSAPLMKRISTWTTYFPISDRNGFGANIWIPAEDIDGYVIAPGEWFDFWDAIGPISRDRGYRDGGAIINGRTEPQGALAGGICSTSTTLFNAALRAGLEMGDRRNHYYYISRYPVGLDATVFRSGSGNVQTMSFRNDTEHPILIRGIRTREGSRGYVRFDLYSVPNGREVSFSRPVVKNIRSASDSIEYTSTLRPGQRERIESPVDGKDVWVTRTVRTSAGNVLHRETYYSHYARITGVVLVGR